MQGKQMDAAERSVDMTMHVAGMAFCLRAALVLMVQAAMSGAGLTVAAATVYALGMVVMLFRRRGTLDAEAWSVMRG